MTCSGNRAIGNIPPPAILSWRPRTLCGGRDLVPLLRGFVQHFRCCAVSEGGGEGGTFRQLASKHPISGPFGPAGTPVATLAGTLTGTSWRFDRRSARWHEPRPNPLVTEFFSPKARSRKAAPLQHQFSVGLEDASQFFKRRTGSLLNRLIQGGGVVPRIAGPLMVVDYNRATSRPESCVN